MWHPFLRVHGKKKRTLTHIAVSAGRTLWKQCLACFGDLRGECRRDLTPSAEHQVWAWDQASAPHSDPKLDSGSEMIGFVFMTDDAKLSFKPFSVFLWRSRCFLLAHASQITCRACVIALRCILSYSNHQCWHISSLVLKPTSQGEPSGHPALWCLKTNSSAGVFVAQDALALQCLNVSVEWSIFLSPCYFNSVFSFYLTSSSSRSPVYVYTCELMLAINVQHEVSACSAPTHTSQEVTNVLLSVWGC